MSKDLNDLKQAVESLEYKAAGYIARTSARIAELEAENAELLQAIKNWRPTRKQVAALVKPLEWSNGIAFGVNGSYHDCGYNVVFEDMQGDPVWSSDSCDTPAKLKEAAEAHHRETVLSLLNLPA
jgi:hypothetical protein